MPAGAPRSAPAPNASARRDEVLSAAAGAFERHGYAGTSMRRIADEAGILPGSLYHHFDAKESIAAELVERMQRDLAEVVARFSVGPGNPETLRALARETATLSERHRAAVELCLYEAPTSASPRLADLLRARPLGDEAAWRRLVRDAVGSGALRLPEGDADLLALALLESSWTIGLVSRDVPAPALADVCTDVLLRGLLAERDRPPLAQRRLDAVLAEIARRWRSTADGDDSRRRELLDTARDEFARRGFDATTMRDVAVATGTPMATLYRRFRSKEELLGEIVHRFSGPLLVGFRDVVAGADGPLQALDGLIGVMALAGSVFGREYDAVRTWWRVVVPAHPDASADEQGERLAILRGVLAAGVAEGSLRAVVDVDVLAVCVRELLWLPYRQLREDPGQVQDFLRRTVLSGAAA